MSVIAVVAHGLAQAEREDDAQDLHRDDPHRHPDDDIQVVDQRFVDLIVAPGLHVGVARAGRGQAVLVGRLEEQRVVDRVQLAARLRDDLALAFFSGVFDEL